MTTDEANEVRLKRVLQTAVRTARSAEDAAEAQAVLDAMFPPGTQIGVEAAPESPMALADAVQAEVTAATEAAFDRADDQDPDAPKKRKKA